MNVLIIGLGNMGAAIARAVSEDNKVHGVDPQIAATQIAHHTEKSHATAGNAMSSPGSSCEQQFSFPVYPTLSDASSSINLEIELIILAVKPQVVSSVLQELREYLSQDTLVISTVAGTEIHTISTILKSDNIARIMPTIAAKKKESFTALSTHPKLSDAHVRTARVVCAHIGKVLEVPEHLISAITGLSGSGIAFVASMIDALTMAGVREGIAYPDAYAATLQTVKGALSMLSPNEAGFAEFQSPSQFISAVCSPGGTTIEGIQALNAHGFAHAIFQAVHSAREKSDQLSCKK